MRIRGNGGFLPDSTLVAFNYYASLATQTGINNAGGQSASREYCTGLFQVDPNVTGPSTIPGRDAWSNFYTSYRPYAIKVVTEFANLESFPVTCVQYPEGTQQEINNSAVVFWPDNRWAKSIILSGKGGQDRGKITTFVNVMKFAGDKETAADESWTGLLSLDGSNPNQMVFVELGILPLPYGTLLVNGVACRTIVTIYCRLYGYLGPNI